MVQTPSSIWFYGDDENEYGPFSVHELQTLFENGEINAQASVWTAESKNRPIPLTEALKAHSQELYTLFELFQTIKKKRSSSEKTMSFQVPNESERLIWFTYFRGLRVFLKPAAFCFLLGVPVFFSYKLLQSLSPTAKRPEEKSTESLAKSPSSTNAQEALSVQIDSTSNSSEITNTSTNKRMPSSIDGHSPINSLLSSEEKTTVNPTFSPKFPVFPPRDHAKHKPEPADLIDPPVNTRQIDDHLEHYLQSAEHYGVASQRIKEREASIESPADDIQEDQFLDSALDPALIEFEALAAARAAARKKAHAAGLLHTQLPTDASTEMNGENGESMP